MKEAVLVYILAQSSDLISKIELSECHLSSTAEKFPFQSWLNSLDQTKSSTQNCYETE